MVIIRTDFGDLKYVLNNMNATLEVAKYEFRCRFLQDTVLPNFKGSTFRGGFGRALRNISCGIKDSDCSSCKIKNSCLYAKVFEQDLEKLKEDKNFSPAHPYVIECDDNKKTRFQKDDYFIFNLILFGEYIYKIPYFIYAVVEMGKIGFGRKNENGERAKFIIRDVISDGKEIYSDVTKEINNSPNSCMIRKKYFEYLFDDYKELNQVSIVLETPLRFKQKSVLTDTLSFETLIKLVIRRLNTLFKMYGSDTLNFNLDLLFEESKKVQILENNLYWKDNKRYSLRQKHSMILGGLQGEIKYKGNLAIFMPFLMVAKDLHLGKQTSFGLGKIDVKI